MKEFWVYTSLRIVLFLASVAIVGGIWALVAGDVLWLWVIVAAFLMSGLGSYFLLNHQREALAQRVQVRAEAMTSKIDEMRAKEDVDDEP